MPKRTSEAGRRRPTIVRRLSRLLFEGSLPPTRPATTPCRRVPRRQVPRAGTLGGQPGRTRALSPDKRKRLPPSAVFPGRSDRAMPRPLPRSLLATMWSPCSSRWPRGELARGCASQGWRIKPGNCARSLDSPYAASCHGTHAERHRSGIRRDPGSIRLPTTVRTPA